MFKDRMLHGLTFVLVVCLATPAWSEGTKKERELPQSGVLSGSTSGGFGSHAVAEPWGGVTTEGESGAPIQGSASRIDDRTWLVKVFNNSEDKFRVTIQLIQRDGENRKVKTNSFATSIPGGGKEERRMPGHPSATNSEVRLVSWKRFKKKRSAEELQQLIAEKEKEIKDLKAELGELGSK